MTTSLLQARGVSVHFAGVAALDGVDLAIARGEIVGLLGPNGSGKSTLVDVLAGVRAPSRGALLLDGRALPARRGPRTLAGLGVARTFQNLRLFDELTVTENILVPLTAAHRLSVGDARPRAAALLEQAGLGAFGDRVVATLSYGDRRRVELVRAEAIDPAFLLLDEPAAGMNGEETLALATRIRGIVDRLGCGVLLIEHDVGFVFALADRVVALAQGRVIAEGPPEAVRADPAVQAAYLGTAAR